MAPEQFVDFKGADQRTDIYALGKMLYEAVDGKMPENAVPFTRARLKEAEIPFFKKLDEIIQAATDEKPDNRFQSVGELKVVLEDALSLASNGDDSDRRETGKDAAGFNLSRRSLAVIGSAVAVLMVIIAFWGYHSIREHAFQEPRQEVRKVEMPKGLPVQISARDGSILKLIPGGQFYVPAGFDEKGARSVKLKPFYMDETPVTNQQFVDFLNAISKDLKVADGAVKENERILLYLGQVMQGYESIVYENGLFRMSNTAHSACPVLRVTAFGAQAFASYHHERLPGPVEWLYAVSEGHVETASDGTKKVVLPESFFEPLELPYPVMLMKPNLFGVKGLNINLGCWVKESSSVFMDGRKNSFAILGGFEKADTIKDLVPRPVRRNPWEAFEEVGFRCVRDSDLKAVNPSGSNQGRA